MCILFVAGDVMVWEKRDEKNGNQELKDLSHPSTT